MEMARIFLSAAAEIAVSLFSVVLSTMLCVKAAERTRHPYLAVALMIALLGAFLLAGPDRGPIRVMVLTFGLSSSLLLFLWARLEPAIMTLPHMNERTARHWSYPALIAAMGESRRPSSGELRTLLVRIESEVQAQELSPRSKAALIKRIARMSLRMN